MLSDAERIEIMEFYEPEWFPNKIEPAASFMRLKLKCWRDLPGFPHPIIPVDLYPYKTPELIFTLTFGFREQTLWREISFWDLFTVLFPKYAEKGLTVKKVTI